MFDDIARKNARDRLECTLVIVRIVITFSKCQFVFDYKGSCGSLTSTRHGCTVFKEMLDKRRQRDSSRSAENPQFLPLGAQSPRSAQE